MKLVVLPKFNSIQDGVSFMETFKYPCAFLVNENTYDYMGIGINITEETVEIPNNVLYTISGYGNEDTLEGVLYVESGICKCNKVG